MNIWLDYKRDTNWISEDHNPHSKKKYMEKWNTKKNETKMNAIVSNIGCVINAVWIGMRYLYYFVSSKIID